MFESVNPGPVKSAASEIDKFTNHLGKDGKASRAEKYKNPAKLISTARKAFDKIHEMNVKGTTPKNQKLFEESLENLHSRIDSLKDPENQKIARGIEFLILSQQGREYSVSSTVELDLSSEDAIRDIQRTVLSNAPSTPGSSSRVSSASSEEQLYVEELELDGISADLSLYKEDGSIDLDNDYFSIIEPSTIRGAKTKQEKGHPETAEEILEKATAFYSFKNDMIDSIQEYATQYGLSFGSTEEEAETLFERSRILSCANRMSMGGGTIGFQTTHQDDFPFTFSFETLDNGSHAIVCSLENASLRGFIPREGKDIAKDPDNIIYSYKGYIPMSEEAPEAAQMIETFSKPRD